ncbi:MAG: ABC transporter permease [Anaerolineae bacterium]|nr:ABC transporter permease [Anaerolineae bacterium]MBT7070229.1 ABC transporter permease [Anaerolineae bacterium]MBT7324960.1 ABC transporter permease [Anaerolineae bacterium]
MTQYTIRRILYSIPVIFGILLVTFVMARSIPGEPCTAMLGEKATAEVCERFNHEQGFDKPIVVQFGIYMKNIFAGDFGDSIRYSRPVTKILLERLPTTIELGLIALFLAILVGIPAGIISAVRRNSAIDVGVMIAANTGVSMPVYWLGLVLAYVFALLLKDTPFWLPPSGRISAGVSAIPFYEVFHWEAIEGTTKYIIMEFFANMYVLNSIITRDWEVLGDVIKHIILPAVALSTIPLAIIARMTRSSMLEVLRQDYIRTARAKGLFERFVIMKHALRNALLPVITIIGLQVGTLFAGAVLTETIFGFAGVGRMLFEAITARDFPIVQGFTIVIAIGYVGVNLLVDLSYVFIDPRIRLD